MENKSNTNLQERQLLFFMVSMLLENPKFMEKFIELGGNENPILAFSRLLVALNQTRADGHAENERDGDQSAARDVPGGAKKISLVPELDLSPEEKKQLKMDYLGLFFGLAWLQWMQPGKSLADAWRAAHDIAARMIEARAKQHPKNPGMQYLRQVSAEKKHQTQKCIAEFKHVDQPMNVPKDQRAEYARIGNEAYNKSIAGIDAKLKTLGARATANTAKAEKATGLAQGAKIVQMFQKDPNLAAKLREYNLTQWRQNSIAV